MSFAAPVKSPAETLSPPIEASTKDKAGRERREKRLHGSSVFADFHDFVILTRGDPAIP
jgi:hypothetical protein